MANNDPAKAYTLTEFINMKASDELTYHNFAIIEKIKYMVTNKSTGVTTEDCSAELVEQNVLDFYLDELKALVVNDSTNGVCVKVDTITKDEIAKYKYQPDLLAYDIYGSTQLDFIILLCNGIIDSKDFDLKSGYLILPIATRLNTFLSKVYNAESTWLDDNSD